MHKPARIRANSRPQTIRTISSSFTQKSSSPQTLQMNNFSKRTPRAARPRGGKSRRQPPGQSAGSPTPRQQHLQRPRARPPRATRSSQVPRFQIRSQNYRPDTGAAQNSLKRPPDAEIPERDRERERGHWSPALIHQSPPDQKQPARPHASRSHARRALRSRSARVRGARL